MMLLVPEYSKVRSSHCGSSTESGVSAPQVTVKPDVGSAVSRRPTSPMKSGSLAASAGEDTAGTNFVFIVEDQLPPERNELFDAQRRETVSGVKGGML